MIGGCREPIRHGWVHRIYAYLQLNQNRQWLATLPASADAGHGIFACHGTPTNDNEYLIEVVSEHRLVRASLATMRERLGDVQARVGLCGHSHRNCRMAH
jgi:hypothetical protein